MIAHSAKNAVQKLLANQDLESLRKAPEKWQPADVAEAMANLPTDEQASALSSLPLGFAAETFVYLNRDSQQQLLLAIHPEKAAGILNEISPDDRTAFLQGLPGEAVAQILKILSPEERAVAQSLLNFPPQSVGRLMTTDFLEVREDWTAGQVLDHVRENARQTETLDAIFAVDAAGRLVGEVQIHDLLLHPLHQAVRDICREPAALLRPTDDQESAVAVFKEYDRMVLPVVDSNRKLIGIVTADDVLDVEEAEATEDIQKLGGVEALGDSYLDMPIRRMIGKRAGWLVILFLGELLTATAMAFFEEQIAKAVVLALFVPLIISSGGNSGSQATTLIIRALSLGEVKLQDWWRVVRREVISGCYLGGILGGLGFLRIAAWALVLRAYGEHWLLVALTVGLSLIGVVLWGTLVGSMLPFLLSRLGFDPATSSAPFVATLVDVTGIVIYFGVAIWVLQGTLL